LRKLTIVHGDDLLHITGDRGARGGAERSSPAGNGSQHYKSHDKNSNSLHTKPRLAGDIQQDVGATGFGWLASARFLMQESTTFWR
jgi:hypothetical protein